MKKVWLLMVGIFLVSSLVYAEEKGFFSRFFGKQTTDISSNVKDLRSLYNVNTKLRDDIAAGRLPGVNACTLAFNSYRSLEEDFWEKVDICRQADEARKRMEVFDDMMWNLTCGDFDPEVCSNRDFYRRLHDKFEDIYLSGEMRRRCNSEPLLDEFDILLDVARENTCISCNYIWPERSGEGDPDSYDPCLAYKPPTFEIPPREYTTP